MEVRADMMGKKLSGAFAVMFLAADFSKGRSTVTEAAWLAEDVLKFPKSSERTVLLREGKVFDHTKNAYVPLRSAEDGGQGGEGGNELSLCVDEFILYFHSLQVDDGLTEEEVLDRLSKFVEESERRRKYRCGKI